MPNIIPILTTVLVSAIGYGISFPLLGTRVEATGVPGTMIGLNAAMPALGWIVGSALVPVLQLHFRIPIAKLAISFLLCAAIGIVGLRYAETFEGMTALRLVFGGGMGLFYRSVEYWINGLSEDAVRARNLAMNGVAFMLGLVIGSALQPEFGSSGWMSFAPVLALLVLAALGTFFWPSLAPPPASAANLSVLWSAVATLPMAYAAGLAYGLYESVPAYLNQIYALKLGLGEDIAAYTLTVAALGNLLVPIPVAVISDRYGRRGPLIACSLTAAAASLAIPWTLDRPTLFLGAILLAAGFAGGVYGLALASIGDRFKGARLVVANAAFGMVYSTASLIGPLLNGASIDTLDRHGLMAVASAVFGVLTILLLITRREVRESPISGTSAGL